MSEANPTEIEKLLSSQACQQCEFGVLRKGDSSLRCDNPKLRHKLAGMEIDPTDTLRIVLLGFREELNEMKKSGNICFRPNPSRAQTNRLPLHPVWGKPIRS